nr:hypothetical protein [Tanacetum cinerariifolium]
LVSSDDEEPMKDQPLTDDASATAISRGYLADSNPEEDLEDDLKEDPVKYPINGGEDDDDESFDNDD